MSTALKIAKVLCGGFPKVCDTHVAETMEVLELLPELLTGPGVIEAAARAYEHGYDLMHPADQTLAKQAALEHLAGAARELTKEVPR